MNTAVQALTFNGVTLSPISHKNQTWLTSIELAKSLGYADEKSVSRIFTRNKDEFSGNMTTLFQGGQIDHLGESKGIQNGTRIFSLRGCHLIAMFAKTVIAKQFRVWVLDILDKEVNPKPYALRDQFTCPFANQTQSIAPSIEYITPQQKLKLDDMVSRIKICVHFDRSASWNLYEGVRTMYKIESIDKLPAQHFDAVYRDFQTLHELAKDHSTLMCEMDRNFIKFTLKQQHFKLKPQQYALAA